MRAAPEANQDGHIAVRPRRTAASPLEWCRLVLALRQDRKPVLEEDELREQDLLDLEISEDGLIRVFFQQ